MTQNEMLANDNNTYIIFHNVLVVLTFLVTFKSFNTTKCAYQRKTSSFKSDAGFSRHTCSYYRKEKCSNHNTFAAFFEEEVFEFLVNFKQMKFNNQSKL